MKTNTSKTHLAFALAACFALAQLALLPFLPSLVNQAAPEGRTTTKQAIEMTYNPWLDGQSGNTFANNPWINETGPATFAYNPWLDGQKPTFLAYDPWLEGKGG